MLGKAQKFALLPQQKQLYRKTMLIYNEGEKD